MKKIRELEYMTNYCAIVPFYDDYAAGIRLLKQLRKMNCPSIWADGPFKEYHDLHGGDPVSSDGLRNEIVSGDSSILIDCGICYVQDKWNALLKTAGDIGYEYAFLFGCDEIPQGSFEKCISEIPKGKRPMVYRIHMEEKGDNTGEHYTDHSGPKERIFYRPSDIEVRDLHWAFFDRTMKDSYPIVSTKEAIPYLSFTHDNTVRSKDRDRRMQQYQAKRVPGEYRRSREVIQSVFKREHLTRPLLETLYPGCTVEEQIRYNGMKAFKVIGSSDIAPLDDYCSYVKLPFNDGSGLYITKSRIDTNTDGKNTSDN